MGSEMCIRDRLSGPGSLTFENPNKLTSNVSADTSGLYVLELYVDDNSFFATDTIELRVAEGCLLPTLSGATHWWSFNGHARDLVGNADGYWYGTPSYQEGFVHQSVDSQRNQNVIEVASPNGEANPMKEVDEAPFSIEYWVKYDGTIGSIMSWNDDGTTNNNITQFASEVFFLYLSLIHI